MDGTTIMEIIHADGRTDSDIAVDDARQAAAEKIVAEQKRATDEEDRKQKFKVGISLFVR